MNRVRTTAALLLCVAASLLPAAPHAQAVDPVVVMHSDFEDGTTQGWFGRGAAALSVSTEAAHAGVNGLRTTGRTATWNGPGRNVLSTVQKAATYAIEAHVRLVAGQAATAVHMTMQRTPDGGSTVFERVASSTVTDAAWTVPPSRPRASSLSPRPTRWSTSRVRTT
ncbi:MAG TPA: carbohydrate binding domain-containing protein [Candidatus Limnocylindrales bacterium]|nr:carbohydrate binding domain-containing protein [Candidatus Limnocylindrales bacterium]